jgi:hypothetical protein
MTSRDWRFPMACPACQAIQGNPFRVSTTNMVLTTTVEVRCAECRHEWGLSAETPSLFGHLFEKATDRRRVPRV